MNSANLLNKNRTVLRAETHDMIVAGISDVGCVRVINEDCIWIHETGKVLLLADGMGGHDRGADASRIALETLSEELLPEKINLQLDDITLPDAVSMDVGPIYTVIHRAVKEAAAVMAERNYEMNLSKYMGTTIAGFVISEKNHIVWFHVGDSRAYRLRDGKLSCLTVDHSLYAEWEKAGSPGAAPGRHLVTRVLGNNPEVEADIKWGEKKKGDIYLLCSDGLNDMLTDKDIEKILKRNRNITRMAEKLVDEALAAGGKDNVSVILCKIL
ncbi:MAG: serine/threonine-protein phosphatase [Deltaproteobacteria bacterium]|nr:serine/threonine-protein phosphatase [Deltaproteobacteria bacterium]